MAESKILTNEGTIIVFAPSGGDVTFTPTSLANGAGRVSAQVDLGAAPRTHWYRWTARFKVASTAGLSASLRLYLFGADAADATRQAGAVGISDAAKASEALFYNASRQLPPVLIDETGTSKSFQKTGIVRLADRYVSVGWFNGTGVALSGTAADHEFTLTPIMDAVQESA